MTTREINKAPPPETIFESVITPIGAATRSIPNIQKLNDFFNDFNITVSLGTNSIILRGEDPDVVENSAEALVEQAVLGNVCISAPKKVM